jgi:lipopolysaccharide export system permease protein
VTRLSRYILRETAGTWLAVTAVLVVVLLTNQVATVLARAAERGFPSHVVLELVGLGLLQNLAILLPVGLLLGVMLAFGRLYHDSEMTAVVACGVSPRAVYTPIFALALVVAVIVAALSLYIGPRAAMEVERVRTEALQQGEFAPIAPGRFRSFGGGSTVFYARGVQADGTLERVFVKRLRDDRYEIAVADFARHEISADSSIHVLTLISGERYEGNPGSPQFRIIRFAENVIPVQVPGIGVNVPKTEGLPTSELLTGADPERRAEWHWRVAAPLMVLILAVLAVPLSRLRPRQGRYSRLWLAILIYFFYIGLASAARVWLTKGELPAVLGLWWVHGLVIAVALIVIGAPGVLARWRHRDVVPA